MASFFWLSDSICIQVCQQDSSTSPFGRETPGKNEQSMFFGQALHLLPGRREVKVQSGKKGGREKSKNGRGKVSASPLLSSPSSQSCSQECSPHFCSAGTVQQPAVRRLWLQPGNPPERSRRSLANVKQSGGEKRERKDRKGETGQCFTKGSPTAPTF